MPLTNIVLSKNKAGQVPIHTSEQRVLASDKVRLAIFSVAQHFSSEEAEKIPYLVAESLVQVGTNGKVEGNDIVVTLTFWPRSDEVKAAFERGIKDALLEVFPDRSDGDITVDFVDVVKEDWTGTWPQEPGREVQVPA